MDQETRALVEHAAEEAAERAVARTLLTLGVDSSNPLDTQRDMAAIREMRAVFEGPDFQLDMLHLRRWRMTMEKIESRGFTVAVYLACIGGAALVLYAFRLRLLGIM